MKLISSTGWIFILFSVVLADVMASDDDDDGEITRGAMQSAINRLEFHKVVKVANDSEQKSPTYGAMPAASSAKERSIPDEGEPLNATTDKQSLGNSSSLKRTNLKARRREKHHRGGVFAQKVDGWKRVVEPSERSRIKRKKSASVDDFTTDNSEEVKKIGLPLRRSRSAGDSYNSDADVEVLEVDLTDGEVSDGAEKKHKQKGRLGGSKMKKVKSFRGISRIKKKKGGRKTIELF